MRVIKYNFVMDTYRFTHPIEVRYGDLDPQWHLNNARYLTLLEQGRFAYLIALGLWDGESFFDLKSIVADVHISFLAPVKMMQPVLVKVKVSRIGTKSLTFDQELTDAETGQVLARCETVIVTFDYHAQKSIPVPDFWREKITAFENGDVSK
jgi:acyl-CoA thioester hydrolase